jgi:hypothetical protein
VDMCKLPCSNWEFDGHRRALDGGKWNCDSNVGYNALCVSSYALC